MTSYEFLGLKSQKWHRAGIAAVRQTRKVTTRELAHIRDIESQAIPYFHGDALLDPKGPQYRRNALANRRITKVSDFYTRRNLRAIACLWAAIQRVGDARLSQFLQFIVTAIMHQGSRRNKWPTQSTTTGTLYIPSISIEQQFLAQVQRKLDVALASIPEWYPLSTPLIECGTATDLSRIPTHTVDYIFTDPPFGSNIYYSEMNLLLEAWLGATTDSNLEAVVHRKNDGGTKRLPDYARLMEAAFQEMCRVLKPGRWATVVFNNKDGAVFEVIKQAVRRAGFEIVNMLLLDKEQKTFKQVKGAEGVEDVVDKDVLFNLHKPAVAHAQSRAEDHDVEQLVGEAVRRHLQTLPDRIRAEPAKYNDEHRTTATINSMLMNTLIPRGVSVERLNLPFIERVCGRYFRKVGQRWYLRGESIGGEDGDHLFARPVAVEDEVTAIEWLRRELQARPMLLGELKPLWMRATGLLSADVSQSLVLEELLTENFWRDAVTNRWREPTPEERERMNDDRSLRVLHDAERFVGNALRRETTDEERCQWIDVLFQACRAIEDNEMDALPALRGFDKVEAYGLIPRLFQSVLKNHVPRDAYARAEKQARAASQRVIRQAESAQSSKAPARRSTEQSKLDFEG